MGQRQRRHFKETRRVPCASLLTGAKPNGYYAGVDRRAREMFEQLAEQMAKREGVTKPLNVTNSMEAVRKINSLRSAAAEAVFYDLIHA